MPSTSPVAVFSAANRLSVPLRLYSKPWLSARPGDSGSIRSLRSSAWIAVFSSTQNTAACAGGFRYSPITSAALASKPGSLEIMCRSRRCGCTLCLRQMRCTVMNGSRNSAASLRLLQCVEPSRGLRLSVCCSTRASSLATIAFGRATHGGGQTDRQADPATKRPPQVAMKRESHRNSRLIDDHDAPSSSSEINRARRTCAAAAVRAALQLRQFFAFGRRQRSSLPCTSE